MSEIESPCIGVCSQNPETGQCYGCQRTLKEIADWPTMSDQDKLKLIEELDKRADELFGD
jgi:predicted Fe-S protein YdhL (DUF1289 family)